MSLHVICHPTHPTHPSLSALVPVRSILTRLLLSFLFRQASIGTTLHPDGARVEGHHEAPLAPRRLGAAQRLHRGLEPRRVRADDGNAELQRVGDLHGDAAATSG